MRVASLLEAPSSLSNATTATGSVAEMTLPKSTEVNVKDSASRFSERKGVLVASLLLAMALLATTSLLIETPNGTLKVTVFDPEIEVTVKGTGVVINGSTATGIEVQPGNHTLHVSGQGFNFDTSRQLSLKEEATVVVKVELLTDEIRVTGDGLVLGSAPRKHSDSLSETKQTSKTATALPDPDATNQAEKAAETFTPVDILSQITPQFVLDGKVTKHSKKEWVFWKGGLLAFPADVSDDYRLIVDFEHTAGPHGTFGLLIAVDDRFVEMSVATTDSEFGVTLRKVGSSQSKDVIAHNSARPFKQFGRNVMHIDVHQQPKEERIRVSIGNREFLNAPIKLQESSAEHPHPDLGEGEMAIKCGSEAIFVIREIQLEPLTAPNG